MKLGLGEGKGALGCRCPVIIGITRSLACLVLTVLLLTLLFAQHLQDLGRVSSNNGIRRHILGHNTSCSDRDALSNSDTRANDSPTSNPDIISDHNRHPELDTLGPNQGINRVCGTEELDVGRKEDIVADRDLATVQNHTVEVHVDILAHRDVTSIVGLEGRLDPATFSDTATSHRVEEGSTLKDPLGGGLGRVVDLHQFTDTVAFEDQELVGGVVDFCVKHALLMGVVQVETDGSKVVLGLELGGVLLDRHVGGRFLGEVGCRLDGGGCGDDGFCGVGHD